MKALGVLGELTLWLIVASAGLSTSGAQTESVRRADPDLVKRIVNGDHQAVVEAGSSEDRGYIPILKQASQELDLSQAEASSFVEVTIGSSTGVPQKRRIRRDDLFQLALAKLGDANAQQRIWCRGGLGLFWQLQYVGGWYGIMASEQFLSARDEKAWKKYYRDYERESKRENKDCHRQENQVCMAGDTAPAPPDAFWALTTLSRIVPDAPISFQAQSFGNTRDPDYYLSLKPHIAEWQSWIVAHRDNLRKLEPTGEGVDFSRSACKDGKPVESTVKSK